MKQMHLRPDLTTLVAQVLASMRLNRCRYCGGEWRLHEIQQDEDREGTTLVGIFHCAQCGARKFEPYQ
jgi:hypothetical protein